MMLSQMQGTLTSPPIADRAGMEHAGRGDLAIMCHALQGAERPVWPERRPLPARPACHNALLLVSQPFNLTCRSLASCCAALHQALMLAASSAGGAGIGDGAPISLNPDQRHHSAGAAAQASDRPAGSRRGRGKLRSCLRHPPAAAARSRKRVRFDNVPSPPPRPRPKRARCKAPAAGFLQKLAAASAAAAAQEDSPLSDEWGGDVPAGYASAERRRESEEAHRLKCGAEAHNARLMCDDGRGPLWEDTDMPPAEQGVAGSSADLPAPLHAGHGGGWAAAGGHPAAPIPGSLQAHQRTSAGLVGPNLPESEAVLDMETEYLSEPVAMLSGSFRSDFYDLE